jgi:hypothetical protein
MHPHPNTIAISSSTLTIIEYLLHSTYRWIIAK